MCAPIYNTRTGMQYVSFCQKQRFLKLLCFVLCAGRMYAIRDTKNVAHLRFAFAIIKQITPQCALKLHA